MGMWHWMEQWHLAFPAWVGMVKRPHSGRITVAETLDPKIHDLAQAIAV
jgi:hypothetical protein